MMCIPGAALEKEEAEGGSKQNLHVANIQITRTLFTN
jgi:hypothetical protein